MKKVILFITFLFSIGFISSLSLNETMDYDEKIYLSTSLQGYSENQTDNHHNFLPTNSLTLNLMQKYFLNLNENIGFNAFGSCGLVAIGMLLSYYDTVWDDRLIPEKYDKTENISVLSNEMIFNSSSGIIGDKAKFLDDYNQKINLYGRYSFNNYKNFIEENTLTYFHLYLLDIALNSSSKYINVYNLPNGEFSLGMTFNQINSFLKNYLESSFNNISIQTNYDRNLTAKSYAIEMIQQGVPVLMGIRDDEENGHVVVAYEYNEETDEIYFNTGLEDFGSYSCLSYIGYDFYDFSIAITNLEDHICSNNFSYNGESYCACDFYSIYPTHQHHYRRYRQFNLIQHYELCLCDAMKKSAHTINTKDYIRKNGKLYSNCIYCLQMLEINIDGPIQGILSIEVPIDMKERIQ